MNKFRLIEITEGVAAGESFMYLTNAPDAEILKAIEIYRESDDDAGFKELLKKYTFEPVIDTPSSLLYDETKKHMKVEKTYELY